MLARMRSVLTAASFAQACVAACAAAAAETPVGSAEALAAAIAGAQGGETFVLAPGSYGDLSIAGRRFAETLVLRAADPSRPPRFSSVRITRSANITLEGLDIVFGPSAAPLSDAAVFVAHAEAIRLVGLAVASAPNGVAGDDAQGVRILSSRKVTLSDARIEETYRGALVFESDAVVIRGCIILGSGADGIAARGAQDFLVEGNIIGDFRPVNAAAIHPDGVQLWSKSAARASRNVVIRGNVIRRGDGAPAQGVFARTPEIATEGLVIENNVIEQSMGQGIFVQNAVGVTIRGNTLSPVAPLVHPPAIEVRAPFSNALVEHNAAPKFRLPPGVDARANAATTATAVIR